MGISEGVFECGRVSRGATSSFPGATTELHPESLTEVFQ